MPDCRECGEQAEIYTEKLYWCRSCLTKAVLGLVQKNGHYVIPGRIHKDSCVVVPDYECPKCDAHLTITNDGPVGSMLNGKCRVVERQSRCPNCAGRSADA